MNLENNSTDSTQSSESAAQPEPAKKPARRRVVRSAGTPSAIIASVEAEKPAEPTEPSASAAPTGSAAPTPADPADPAEPADQPAKKPAAKRTAAKKSPARKTSEKAVSEQAEATEPAAHKAEPESAPAAVDPEAAHESSVSVGVKKLPAEKTSKRRASAPKRTASEPGQPLDVLSEFGLKAPETPVVPEAPAASGTSAASETPVVSETPAEPAPEAPKASAPKTTKRAQTKTTPAKSHVSDEQAADETVSTGGRLATTALLFQAPDPAARPKRRRASAPAGPPEAVAPTFAGVAARSDSDASDVDEDAEETQVAAEGAADAQETTKQSSRSGQRQNKQGSGRSGRTKAVDSDQDAELESADDATESDSDSDESSEGGNGSGNARRRRRRGGRGRRSRSGGGSDSSETDSTDGESDDESDSEDDSADTGSESKSDSAEAQPKRGGRGRKGGKADNADNAPDSSEDDEQDESDDDHDESGDDSDGSSSRRRRRRRRGGRGSDSDSASNSSNASTGSNGSGRDSGAARSRSRGTGMDEVTALKGSTRLEAKRQRRREGRDAGRRRTIVTEAEFLARRESVDRAMVVREQNGRTQIAVLEDGVLVEHYVSQQEQASVAGNVYLGRVQNVLPSMEAAFIDIGKGRNAVLYAGEVNWDAAGLEGQPRRIEQALKSGDSVLVQVTKDPIGHKGARLTSQVTLAGRYLVYVPGGGMTGISRKLPDMERARLKKILRELVPDNAGVIVRTAAEGATEEELRADIARLQDQWTKIEKKAKTASAPALLQGEPDLAIRVVRDIFNDDFKSLVISGNSAWDEISGYVGELAPDLAERVTRWTDSKDVFVAHRVDEQLAKGMDRKVWLPSGGSLVIDRTEAMTVVDVNTGKFTGSGGTLEETVTRNNLEAAEEIVRQLRLRDIGGIIVIDFIDMVLESNRDLVLRRLVECLGRDRTKHQVAEVTSLGLVQMTRKRVGQGLVEAFSTTCEHCNGRGFLVHAEPNEKNSGGATGQHGGSESSGPSAGHGNQQHDGDSKRSRRKRGGVKDSSAAQAPAAPTSTVPVLPESEAREAVNATLATIAAAAAHAHEQAEQAGQAGPAEQAAQTEQANAQDSGTAPEQKEAAQSHVMVAEQATFPAAATPELAEPAPAKPVESVEPAKPVEPAVDAAPVAEPAPKQAPVRKPATRRKVTKPAGAPKATPEAEPVVEADKSAEGAGQTD